MSLLLSPLVLFALGVFIARISKARRVWKRHGLFTRKASGWVLVLYLGTALSLLLDLAWVRGFAGWLPGATGTDWMINSGILHLDAAWPLVNRAVVAWVIVSFVLFPVWLWSGVTLGYWAFGRSPKQTGIVGLLR